jgi:maleamate amidohydrolase
MNDSTKQDVYDKQGFGQALELKPPAGLLIVDFINGFADPEVLGGGNVAEAIIKAKALLALAREWGWHITYTRVVYAEDGSDTNIFTEKVPGNLLFTEDSDKSAVVPELSPQKGDLIIRKQFPSAFFGTNLASKLALQGIKTLVVAGATTSGCVRASVLDAMCYGFKPILASDCVGDRSIEQHNANLFDMQMKYAEVKTLEEIRELSALNANS